MTVRATVAMVDSITPLGENLSIVKVGDHEVVANRREDGSFRWQPGEWCVYVPENAIVPEDVLKDRGYWEADAKKGLLAGGKGNRVKMRRMAGVESRGLLFKVGHEGHNWTDEPSGFWLDRGAETLTHLEQGQDVTEFLGITEYVPDQ